MFAIRQADEERDLNTRPQKVAFTDKAVTGDEAKQMFDAVNQTRLEILNLWADGEPAKQLEAQLPN
jgi:hypothetical protein